MKGSHGLIGVGRAWCYAINTKRSRSNGNPMDSGPTVYMRWSVSPLRAPDNHLEPFVYCKPLLQPCWRKCLGSHSNLLGEFFDSLPLRLGGSRLTPSLSVRPHRKQKEKVESHCWSSYCGQSSCLAHTQLRSASQLDVRLALTHTHWSREPTSHHGAAEARRGVPCHPKLESLPHLIIHNTVSSSNYTFSELDSAAEGSLHRRQSMQLLCRVSTAELLGTGLLILRGASTCHERAG